MKRAIILLSTGLAACILVAIVVGVLDSTVILPAVTPDNADAVAFSGARAMTHLESIAKKPHPWQSEENERVFEYILSYGQSLVAKYGTDIIETSIQNATGNYSHYDYRTDEWRYGYGSIINAAFLIKGTGQNTGVDGAAIQVSAHYDGVPMGPAATDDGAGCAIMLELASVLASKQSAKGDSDMIERDVLILFVDAEEVGLVGAEYWAYGYDNNGIDIYHPWSALPSFAINMEGSGTATSGAMLIRSNSQFATDAYRRYAPYPKAFSLTEWIYKTISIGRTDSDIYWTQGIHLMDLIWVENRWAYHSKDDSVENVRAGSLQSGGDNILAIVAGASASDSFPERIPYETLVESGVIESGGTVGMESGTVYFSMLGGSMVHMPFVFARVIYILLAIIMGLTMPLFGDRSNGIEVTEDDNSSLHQQAGRGLCARASIRHALITLLNFLAGILTSIIAFAAFGMWKVPSEEEVERREYWYMDPMVAWAGIGAARSFLSLFTIFGTAFLVYTPARTGYRCTCDQRRSGDEENTKGDERNMEVVDEDAVGFDVQIYADGDGHKEESSNNSGNDNERQTSSAIPDCVEVSDGNDNAQKQHLEQLGRDAHAGVFYFYIILLLLLGAIIPDAAGFVLWQPICMWFASLIDALFRCRIYNDRGTNREEGHVSRQFQRWLSRGFISIFPALLLLPAGVYILVNVFGYFMDDLGYWFGAPLVDSFCFGLILPLFTPLWLPLPQKAFLVLCAICGLAWVVTAISCMAI